MYFPWCARDAHSGQRGAPCEQSDERTAGWHRGRVGFNVSVAEVATLVLRAIEARDVCLRARAALGS